MPEISDADLDLFNRLKALGEPDAIESAIAERDRLMRQALIDQAAAAYQYKPAVLARLIGDLPITVADDRKSAKVTVNGQEQSLKDYADKELTEFLPSLTAARAETGTTRVPYVKQSGSDATPPPVSASQSYIDRTYVQPLKQRAS